MKQVKRLLTLMLFSILITGCSNIYYVGESAAPQKIYVNADTNSFTGYTIPAGKKVLVKRGSKNYRQVIFEKYKGYSYKPAYNNYRKFDSKTDGTLYGYSSSRSFSSESSGSGGTVNVKGYNRKNGTYVSPHTRSAPRRRS